MDNKVALLIPLCILQTVCYGDTAVLDPALYLYPSPPMMPIANDPGNDIWGRVPRSTKLQTTPESKTIPTTTTEPIESMEGSETFWPRLRSVDYAVKQIHVPVTFSLSGTYGGLSGGTGGVIGSAYASMGGTSGLYGKSALAGSGYGNYGTGFPLRIYGGNESPAWSGWGNGKWGHYGKG